MNEIKLTLEFLTVLWHCKALGNALYNSISSVLSSIIDCLYDDNVGQNVAPLRGAALTIFSILESDPRFVFKNQKQEILWKVALDAGTSDLHVACECGRLYLACCNQIRSKLASLTMCSPPIDYRIQCRARKHGTISGTSYCSSFVGISVGKMNRSRFF